MHAIAQMAFDDGHNLIGSRLRAMAKALELDECDVNVDAIRADILLLIERDKFNVGSFPWRAHLDLALELLS